jgi:hypothetical protein
VLILAEIGFVPDFQKRGRNAQYLLPELTHYKAHRIQAPCVG